MKQFKYAVLLLIFINKVECCEPDQFMGSSGDCQKCSGVIQNCNICVDNTTCTECQSNFFLQWNNSSSSSCQKCGSHCSICSSKAKCFICDQYYEKDKYQQCFPSCGDGYTLPQQDCDILKDVDTEFDGCTKNCQVEKGFKCQVDSNISTCYYTNTIPVKADLVEANTISNQIRIKLHFDSMLNKFIDFSTEMNMFKTLNVDENKLKLLKSKQVSADQIEVIFQVLQTIDYDTVSIQVKYSHLKQILQKVPNHYTSTIIYQSQDQQQSYGLRYFLLFYLSILSWILCIAGFLFKQLAGLQFALLVQFLGNSLIWYPNLNYTYFYDLGQLSYFVNGLNFHIESAKYIENSSTYEIGLSNFLFSNWNVMPIIGIGSIILWCLILKILQMNYQRLQSTKIKQYFKNVTKEDLSAYYVDLITYDWYFFVMVYNFQPFISYSLLFLTNITIPTNISDIIQFSLSCLLIIIWIVFTAGGIFSYLFRMYRYNFLRNIFEQHFLRSKNYILLFIQFFLLYAVLCFIPNFSFVTFLFPIVIIIYYLIARPYVKMRDNARVIFFQVMIMIIISMRVFYLLAEDTAKGLMVYPLLVLILMVLPLLWTIIAIMASYINQYVKKQAQIQFTNALLQATLNQALNLPILVSKDNKTDNEAIESKRLLQSNNKQIKKGQNINQQDKKIQKKVKQAKYFKKKLLSISVEEQSDRASQHHKFSQNLKKEMKIKRSVKQQQQQQQHQQQQQQQQQQQSQQENKQRNLATEIENGEKIIKQRFMQVERSYFMAKKIFELHQTLSPVNETYLDQYDKL